MPEGPEIRIMSDYINNHSKGRKYIKVFHVKKGNNPIDAELIENFDIEAVSNGKELKLILSNDKKEVNISVFMGMSGNWVFTPTDKWYKRDFTRLRFDTVDNNSLLLYGLYMGPKYKVGCFTGVKRGPDAVKEFDKFKENILNNINNKVFDKPICEVLLDQRYFNGIGAYLCSEIVGRLNINPFETARKIIQYNPHILDMCRDIPIESYNLGGGEIKDWVNPFGKSNIADWLMFYGNKEKCYKQRFGSRNIWINKIYKL